MTKAKRERLEELMAFLKEELDGKVSNTCSFTSALINTVDTIHEGNAEIITCNDKVQSEREIELLDFILAHWQK